MTKIKVLLIFGAGFLVGSICTAYKAVKPFAEYIYYNYIYNFNQEG